MWEHREKKKREGGGGGGSRGQQDSSMRLFTSCTHIDAHWTAHTYTAHTHTHTSAVCEWREKTKERVLSTTAPSLLNASSAPASTAERAHGYICIFSFFLLAHFPVCGSLLW